MTDETVCGACGKIHSISDVELTFKYPDDIFELSDEARQARCRLSEDVVVLDGRQFFIRGLLPFDVTHRARAYHLGVWAEVTEDVFARIRELWHDPKQEEGPALPGMLANAVPFHASAVGLALTIELTGPTTRPRFFLDPVDHSLYVEQLTGIDEHRAFEYTDRGRAKPTPDEWPFDQPPDCAVITVRQILEEGAPIQHVAHNADDHGWQFLTLADANEEDAIVVCFRDVVNRDPSLLKLADLLPGWHAWRPTVESEWIREPTPENELTDARDDE